MALQHVDLIFIFYTSLSYYVESVNFVSLSLYNSSFYPSSEIAVYNRIFFKARIELINATSVYVTSLTQTWSHAR